MGYKDGQNFYWLNIGGWNKTLHAIEKCTNGSKTTMVQTIQMPAIICC
ncbi:MAG: hypothetical protein JW723_15000 [Bacteroidales bacterium]|nr:hypothetical protein [Bacteroidales bacterium]